MQRKAGWIIGGETENIGSGVMGAVVAGCDKGGWIDTDGL